MIMEMNPQLAKLAAIDAVSHIEDYRDLWIEIY